MCSYATAGSLKPNVAKIHPVPDSEPFRFSKTAEELIGDLRGLAHREPRRQVRRPTQPLGNLVEALMSKYQVGRPSPEQTIREQWAELVGSANAHYSHPAMIEARGRLTVLAGHAVVRNELFMHRQTIVARIRKLPGCEHVSALNIRAG
jgi:hypothetical protein